MNTYQLINQWQKILENEFNSLARNDIGYGKGSVVLFLWYKYLYYGKKSDLELCRKYLEQLLQSIQNSLKTPGAFIFIELSEIYFLLSLLNKDRGFKISLKKYQVDIYNILEDFGDQFLEQKNIDPYTGAGYLYYHFLLNKKSKDVVKFVDYINDHKVETKNGYYIPMEPEKDIQLGITHGMAFIVLYLTEVRKIYPKIIDTDLLYGFNSFLKNQRQDFNKYNAHFNDFYGKVGESKLNICYGDLGILYALLKSSKELQKTTDFLEFKMMVLEEIPRINNKKHENYSLLTGFGGISLYFYFISEIIQDSTIINQFIINKISHDEYLFKYLNTFNKNQSFSRRQLSFSEGITGNIIYYMGSQINNYDYAKLFYLIN